MSARRGATMPLAWSLRRVSSAQPEHTGEWRLPADSSVGATTRFNPVECVPLQCYVWSRLIEHDPVIIAHLAHSLTLAGIVAQGMQPTRNRPVDQHR